MKGIIFNLVEEVVLAAHGEAVWDALLERAGLDGTYTSLGNYPDAEIVGLVDAAASMLALPADDVLRWLGRQTIPRMASRWPEFFAPHPTTRSFLQSLNSLIHPEVHKLYPGAACPHFDFGLTPEGHLAMGYHSARRLCGFADGMIVGAGQQFGEDLAVTHVECMHAGDRRCLMTIDAA